MLQVQHWEYHLLDLAHSALESGAGAHLAAERIPLTGLSEQVEPSALSEAYQTCAQITRENSKTFYLAANLLPGDKRRATQALYAFCRVSDDLVDHPQGDCPSGSPAVRLESWRQHVIQLAPSTGMQPNEQAVALAWADARQRHCIPRGYVDQLIDGLTLDLNRVRYETFNDLARYCYGVACTVGLMSMHVTGYTGREAIPYAIRLGVALQLTNILRDVGEDWRAGRLYLPQEELHAFGLDEEDIAAGQVDTRWRAFMQFQIARARRFYQDSLPGVALLHPDGRFAIAAAGELYRAILERIEANDYDVFSQRASLGAWGKLRRLPGIWYRANTI